MMSGHGCVIKTQGYILFLTEPVLSSCNTESYLVVIPGSVEIHSAIHPPLEHLSRVRLTGKVTNEVSDHIGLTSTCVEDTCTLAQVLSHIHENMSKGNTHCPPSSVSVHVTIDLHKHLFRNLQLQHVSHACHLGRSHCLCLQGQGQGRLNPTWTADVGPMG